MGGLGLPPDAPANVLTLGKVASHTIKIVGLVDIASWHGKSAPERRWIVDGLLPESNVTMLAGDGGIGKSVLTLQLLGACALGKAWLGRETRPCKAVGLFCEDDEDELWRRLEAVARHYGATVADLAEHLRIYSRVGQDNLLMTWLEQYGQGETTPTFQQISNLAVDAGAELVVLDSLHDLFGGNENSRSHARQFIGELRALAMHIRGTVLITAHPSLTGRNTGTGESGSTAWNNAVRSRLFLRTPKTEDGDYDSLNDFRELVTKKLNYGPPGGKIRLRWVDGVFVTDEQPHGILGAIGHRNAEANFLDCLDSATAQGRTMSDAPSSPRYAPKAMTKMPQARGYTGPELERAMHSLFDAGRIKVGIVGKQANRLPLKGIVRASQESDETAEADGV